MEILPSLLAAHPLKLQRDIEAMIALDLHYLHIDIIDYHYTPNFGLSLDHCKAIKKAFPAIKLDVHLMTNPTPISLIEKLIDIGVDAISLHHDTLVQPITTDILRNTLIRAAILPSETLQEEHTAYQNILALAVSPGFCGQQLQPQALTTIQQAKERGLHTMLDGGINVSTAAQVAACNPDAVVIGGGLFNQPLAQQRQLIQMLRDPQDSTHQS
ncbi:hypothetical protein [Candidatus Synchoanobacter obligatus]|uniref:Ribulose-phosphate 3-epimerase n=1 Tax=Candidatus Synchoanobacter obligatus TaxID=2919597 RepID=A0ABT1L516_9GAMM|nr:hypothetical protein [Candidatus Synchoanobacter obligatus]MCP8352270.1 hypothetical protein [Candidatus Synchoanobacter obligatus]